MDPRDTLREEVKGFAPYEPGLSIDEIKEKYGLAAVIKLASNENPLGASPLVKKAVAGKADMVFRYPRAGNPDLIAALSRRFGVARECLVAGNGSDELIDLLLRLKVRPGLDNVAAFSPCFSIYVQQTRLCGLTLRQVPLEDDFSFNLEALGAACDDHTALVFVTSPDNPSGHAVTAEALHDFAARLPKRALLVVDEAYVDFADPYAAHSCLERFDPEGNVVVLRTFSKMYGLAGLRLGYAALPEWLADLMLRARLPFSVNLLAEAAGLAALEDEPFRQATLETTLAGRAVLSRELAALGCRVYPSQANFLMFRPPAPAREVFETLLARGVIIRRLSSYALPDHLRVSIGDAKENQAFLAVLAEALHGRG